MLSFFLLTYLFLSTFALDAESVNPKYANVDYAVRGAILQKALKLKEELKNPNHDLPFNELFFCNIGNPQALGQKPISYYRQVLSCVLYPKIMDQNIMPKDVVQRAQEILDATASHSIGAYTHSQGLQYIRNHVAEFIEDRDGYPANPADIYLTNGASSGVKEMLSTFIFEPQHGVLIPIPQYPLYTATVAALGATVVPYYLAEESNWGLQLKLLEEAMQKAIKDGTDVRAFVIINPGNPTGNCLTEEALHSVVRFCEKYDLMLLADEVYQKNVYNPKMKFVSAKKAVQDLKSNIPLISFHSTSKGLIGECGLRGGYFELFNIPDDVTALIYKMASISLCPNTVGQIATDLMVKPVVKGEESYELFMQERQLIYDNLVTKSKMVNDGLNAMPGIKCQNTDGALYAFPQIELPAKFVAKAKEEGYAMPDEYYCMLLLENTGVVTVPGSGFRQVEGTYHFRITILPPLEKIGEILERMGKFHTNLTQQYGLKVGL